MGMRMRVREWVDGSGIRIGIGIGLEIRLASIVGKSENLLCGLGCGDLIGARNRGRVRAKSS